VKFLVLLFSVIIQICVGGIYAWSVFVPELQSKYALTLLQSQILFSLTILIFTSLMILAGRLLYFMNSRYVAAIGGVLFFSGYFLASFSSGNFYILLLGISILAGAGIGFCYICPLSIAVKWFPDKKGLVTGISVAGFGGGAIILVYIVGFLFRMGFDVLTVFRAIAITYGTLILISSFFMISPENDLPKKPEGLHLMIMLKNKVFILLCLCMFAGTFCGLMFIGNLKSILVTKNIDEKICNLAISVFAIGNAVGRISWGFIYDKIRYRTISFSLLSTAISVVCLIFLNFPIAAILSSLFLGFCFGACFVLYASQCSDSFGKENFPGTYPFIFMLSYGIGGSLGPIVGSSLAKQSNDYTLSGLLSIVILLTLSFFVLIKGKESFSKIHP